MPSPYYDNLEATPIDGVSCMVEVERVYGLDWDRFDDRYWQGLARVDEELPGQCDTGTCRGGSAMTRTCRPSSGRRWSRQGCRSTASSRRPPGGPGTSGSVERLAGCLVGCGNSRFACLNSPEPCAIKVIRGYGVPQGIGTAESKRRRHGAVGMNIGVPNAGGSAQSRDSM